MPRTPNKAIKTSLHRFAVPPASLLVDLVQKKYLDRDEFESKEVVVASRPALLVTGYIPTPRPKWVSHAQSLTGVTPDVENRTAVGLLLLRLADDAPYVYGVAWGMAHLIVATGHQDEGFGLRFALRRADSSQLSGLTTHALDSVPKTARTSVLGGASLGAFGMEEVGEVLGRLIGRIPAEGLSSKKPGQNNFITVRGADSLSIPVAKTPEDLLSDLAFIDRIIENEAPTEGLEHLENTFPLRPGHPRIPALNARLSSALDASAVRLALCWPAEWEEEFGEAAAYKVAGAGRKHDGDVEELDLDDLIALVADRLPEVRLERLKSITIQGIAEGGSALSRAIPADRWLTHELDESGERFVYHRGRWYNIGGAFLGMMRGRVQRILGQESTIVFPSWPKIWKTRRGSSERYLGPVTEGRYNRSVLAAPPSGLLLMDKEFVRSEQHPRGFEACDALAVDGTLIHVKRLDDSVAASHLFNQAVVSAEALTLQVDARDEFLRMVTDLSGGAVVLPVDYRPSTVVIAFAGGGTSTEEGLFTFSQVSLGRCAIRMRALGITLLVARIDESDEVLGGDASDL